MLDTIGQANLRSVIRPENTTGPGNNEPTTRESKETQETRPIEKSEETTQAKVDHEKEEEKTTKNVLEGDRVVFEKYNSSGELIIRIPPEKPVDEIV